MANQKLTDLPENTTPAVDDELYIVDNATSTSKRITIANVMTLTSVPADTLLSFEGAGGDTGIKYNTSTGKLEVYVNGVKKADW